MDNDLKELYQQVILDHNKNPRNFKVLEHYTNSAEGYNPLCGDHLYVYLIMDGDIVKDISFTGTGCAISKSSGSIMTSIVKGKTKEEAEKLFAKFHDLVTGKIKDKNKLEELGKLAIFQGVTEFPVRVKCASLPWHTLYSALEKKDEKVSTE
jgi:nitrogen fixation NifU-like protein